MGDERTVTLWWPTGPNELALVAETGWSRWPPQLPDQPIFYSVLLEYWIPAEDLDDLNTNIVGRIEVVSEHRADD